MFKKFGLHAVLIISCAIIIFYPMLSQKPDPEKAEKATAAATRFLSMIDAGKYEISWQKSAKLLSEKIEQKDWVEKLAKVNSIYGPLVERILTKSTFTTSAKDSPDGEYIILLYDSSFKNKASANETIIVTLEEDNVWRVAGYHIK